MKPAPFKYVAARSLDQALALKAEHGDEARFLAGGQSLMPAMNFRLAQPSMLIDINLIAGLDGVARQAGGRMQIGALTRYRTLQRNADVARHLPLLHEAVPHIAHSQIRNRGTLGGNLAHADPASEMPAVVLALRGRLHAQSAGGERWIEAADFFVGALTTALRPDEMLVEVEIPELPPRTGTCFMEVARRRGDFALMGVAVMLSLDEDGACADARLAFCSAGDRPIDAAESAGSLIGSPLVDENFREAAEIAQRAIEPHGSLHASQGYQRHLAGVLARRALLAAAQRAAANL